MLSVNVIKRFASQAVPSYIKVKVNGNQVKVKQGSTLLEVIRASGASVPTLCYHPRFKAQALCRLCLVNVNDSPKNIPSCAYQAHDGDDIKTDSKELNEYRRMDAQFLLSRHPNDCMRCEVSGKCKFQNLVKSEELDDIWPKAERGNLIEHPEHILHDHTSPSIYRDLEKCIECGLCVQACGSEGQDQNIIGFGERGRDVIPITIFDKPLADTACISCGQCTVVCPVGALIERPDWHKVKRILDSGRQRTVVQVAPATRIAIGEEFGMAPGTVNTGRLVNVLRLLGFDFVFDTNFAADLTIMEEAHELLMRVDRHIAKTKIDSNTNNIEADRILNEANDKPLPQFTSCCPGWINWIEINRPDLLKHLSTTKSPQSMLGAVAKRGIFPKSKLVNFPSCFAPLNDPDFKKENQSSIEEQKEEDNQQVDDMENEGCYAKGEEEVYVVSIMPCTAKKDEVVRPGIRGDVDTVLTTRELARMIRARNIPFASLPNDGQFDSPLGEASGAGMIFGASGGVMEAALRTATHLLAQRAKEDKTQNNENNIVDVDDIDMSAKDMTNPVEPLSDSALEFHSLRGELPGVKVATIPGVGDVAVCNGISSAQKLLKTNDWKTKYIAIEVMTCVGGCLGGGGEPKSDDVNILKKRMESVYSIDKSLKRRKSHENSQVKQLYNDLLEYPLSHTSEILLHTSYASRYSDRELLGRFLEAVDHRNGQEAADLFVYDDVINDENERLLLYDIDKNDHNHEDDKKEVELEKSKNAVISKSHTAQWCTNTSVFGTVKGKHAIADLINNKLPPKKKGPGMFRHKFIDSAYGFEVQAGPDKVRFEIETVGKGSRKRISKLTRVPL